MILAIATLIVLLMSYILPFCNGLFVDYLVYGGSVDGVVRYALLLAVSGLFSVVVSYCAGILSVRVTNETAFNLISNTVTSIEHASLSVVERLDASYIEYFAT